MGWIVIACYILVCFILFRAEKGKAIREFALAYNTMPNKFNVSARTDSGYENFKIYFDSEEEARKEIEKWNYRLLHGHIKLTTDNFFKIWLSEYSNKNFGTSEEDFY